MNKDALVKKIIEALTAELELFIRAARASHAEATHEQNKAEDKYDTRGLEASYLARGQSRQVAEIEQSIERFEKLEVKEFSPKTPIDVTALVELETKQGIDTYFLAPRAGGTEVEFEKRNVLVLTPESPLGQQLVGRRKGDRFQLEIAGRKEVCLIKEVA